MSTATTQVIDPQLTPDEQRQLDIAVANDLEFWREQKDGEDAVLPVLPVRLDP